MLGHLQLLGIVYLLCFDNVAAQTSDVLRFVNPLIGTTNGGIPSTKHGQTRSYVDNRAGHVFPGATLPFGMTSLSKLAIFFLANLDLGMAKAVADVDGEDQGGSSISISYQSRHY